MSFTGRRAHHLVRSLFVLWRSEKVSHDNIYGDTFSEHIIEPCGLDKPHPTFVYRSQALHRLPFLQAGHTG